jgi:hypothetical protein
MAQLLNIVIFISPEYGSALGTCKNNKYRRGELLSRHEELNYLAVATYYLAVATYYFAVATYHLAAASYI